MLVETPYIAITNDLQIKVAPVFDEERSLPDQNIFIFMYAVEITNNSQFPVQLLNRQWIIRNGRNEESVVSGPGVLGEQPIIEPLMAYHYSSQCPLDTPSGSMRGFYEFQYLNGQRFKATIPPFFLRLQDTIGNISGLYNPIN